MTCVSSSIRVEALETTSDPRLPFPVRRSGSMSRPEHFVHLERTFGWREGARRRRRRGSGATLRRIGGDLVCEIDQVQNAWMPTLLHKLLLFLSKTLAEGIRIAIRAGLRLNMPSPARHVSRRAPLLLQPLLRPSIAILFLRPKVGFIMIERDS